MRLENAWNSSFPKLLLDCSLSVKKFKKIWYLVAHSCGKTSFCRPPSSVPRWRRWREGMIRRWSLCCIFLSHGAPQKLVLAPTLSFMPWGHCYCYFFRHMIISFAVRFFSFVVSLFSKPWGFFFCRESFPFCREVLPSAVSLFFCRESFSFAAKLFLLPRSYFFCRYSCGHRNRIAQMIFKWKFYLFFLFTRVERVVQTFLSWTMGEDKCAWSLFPSTQLYGGTTHIFSPMP